MLETIGIRDGADVVDERRRNFARDFAKAHRAAAGRQPFARIWVGDERIARKTIEPREETFARGVPARLEASDDRNPPALQFRERVIFPLQNAKHNADGERSGSHHQVGIGRKIDRHFDAVATRTHSDPSAEPVRGQQHHRHMEQMREQQRELPHPGRAHALCLRHGDIEVRRETFQPRGRVGAPFPGVEFVTQKFDLLPKRAAGANAAARLDLDDRRRHLDHARVEINRAARRQVK